MLTNEHSTTQEVSAYIAPNSQSSQILIPGGESIKDSLLSSTSQLYVLVLDQSAPNIKFSVHMEEGELEIGVTHEQRHNNQQGSLLNEKMSSAGTPIFREFVYSGKKQTSQNGDFEKIVVKVTCNRSARFTIGSYQQEAIVHKIKPGTPTIIKSQSNNQLTAYYIDMNALGEVSELELRFDRLNANFLNTKQYLVEKSNDAQKLIENLEFFYLNFSELQNQHTWHRARDRKVILNMTTVEHEERAFTTYKIAPKEGHLMIMLKDYVLPPDSRTRAVLNVGINGMIPMPSSTSLSATIDPTKKHIYQISLKPNSKINVKVSLCQGGNIRAGFLDHNKVPTMKVNPMNPDSILSFLEVITLNSSIKNGRPFKDLSYGPIGGEETVIYLQVEIANNSTQPTAYNVVSEETKIDDYSSIREWIHTLYAPYIKEGKQYPFEWEQDPEEIHHKFPPVLPSQEGTCGGFLL